MAADQGRRKLTAILAADVAGYSRLMADDDRATILTLTEYRDVFAKHIESHEGHVVDTAGDSVLATFESVVEAVEAAVEVQRNLGERNEALPDHRRMHFRIGINLGDIIIRDDGTAYGDGVNVAARLEGLAEPGGVMVSESAHMHVEGRLEVGLSDAGEHEVKNIAKPVRAYRIVMDVAAEVAGVVEAPRHRRTTIAAGLVGILAIVVVAGGWWFTREVVPPPTTEDEILAIPTGPSIAVLAFKNMSGDPEQAYFADGLAEDILTRLSLFANLKVISRSSSFQFRDKATDVREIGRRLGARYIVEGSVRKAGDRIRVTAQLIDAEEDAHLWAETFESDLTSAAIFDIQDNITEKIVAAIAGSPGAISRSMGVSLASASAASLETYECFLLTHAYQRVSTDNSHNRAFQCLRAASKREPANANVWADLAFLYHDTLFFNLDLGIEDPVAEAESAARRSLDLDAGNRRAHEVLAWISYLNRDVAGYEENKAFALSLNPNDPDALMEFAWRDCQLGNWDLGLSLVEKVEKLNPLSARWAYGVCTAWNEYRLRNYEAVAPAVVEWDQSDNYWTHLAEAVACGQMERTRCAQDSIAKAREIYPGVADNIEQELESWFYTQPDFIVHIMEGLEKAGLFDELQAASRPVIAVLPFTNMSGDPEQEYFADGIAEDIITRLSFFEHLGVISRNSTFQFKNQAVDVRKVGEDLEATHLVEGSIRRSANRIKVTVQLIDVEDGNHLWSEAYDRDLTATDVLAIQDEIALRVATTIGDEQGVISRTQAAATRRKAPRDLSSYECVLRMHEYNRLMAEDAHLTARDCLERTVRTDPDYAQAWAALSELHADSFALDYNPVEAPLEKALRAAETAVALDPTNQHALWSLAYTYFHMHDLDKFLVAIDKTVEANPNNAYQLGTAGWSLMLAGEWERGRLMIDEAIALNPYHPGWWHYPTTIYHYIAGRYDEALAEIEKAGMPDNFWTPALYAAVYAKSGRDADAKEAIASVLELNPDFANRPRFYVRAYFFPEEAIEQIMDGLRHAGLDVPDAPTR